MSVMSNNWDSPPTGEVLPVDPLDGTPPDPGTGDVWVSPVAGRWCAVWSHAVDVMVGVRMLETEHPTRDEALAWARQQPANRVMVYDEESQDFVEVQAA